MYVAHRRQIVDLVWLYLLNQSNQVGAVGQIAIMQEKASVTFVWVLIQMIDAVCIEQRGTSFEAVDLIAFFQKELGKVGSVLSGYACDDRFFHVQAPLNADDSKAKLVIHFSLKTIVKAL